MYKEYDPTPQEEINDLLAFIMTAAMVETIPGLEQWLAEEGFTYESLDQKEHLIDLTAAFAERFKDRTERRFGHVKSAAINYGRG
jgi:hypothetical protein